MRCAYDQAAVLIEKFVGLPVQWVANMHTMVLVGEDLTTPAHNETLERPIPFTNPKFAAAWIIEFVETAYLDFRFCAAHPSTSFHGATLNNSNMPGMASATQRKKKVVQPVCSTMTPVTAFASVLGTDVSAVNSAN